MIEVDGRDITISGEELKMLIFIKTDNPLHSFHKTPAFLMQSVFENNKYISFFNIQINDFIDQIKTKSW